MLGVTTQSNTSAKKMDGTFPTDVVRRQMDACMRWALEIKPRGLPLAQMMQSKDRGGVVTHLCFGLCFVGALASTRGVSQKAGASAHDPVGGDEAGQDSAKEDSGQ